MKFNTQTYSSHASGWLHLNLGIVYNFLGKQKPGSDTGPC